MISYRCYILPIVAGIMYILLSLPLIQRIFCSWIPSLYYRIISMALLLVALLFIICRIMDYYFDPCHSK